MRKWYQRKTPEQRRAWIARRDPNVVARNERARWGTPARRASLREASARAHVKNKAEGKDKARNAVHNAVRDGKLKKQPCEVCGTWLVHAHHHNGYDREHWLDVQWLCVRHHKAVHGHLKAA